MVGIFDTYNFGALTDGLLDWQDIGLYRPISILCNYH